MENLNSWLTILANLAILLTIVIKLTTFINKIDTRFHQFALEIDNEVDRKISEHSQRSNHEKISSRLNRIERRLSNVEVKVHGSTDTFGN